MAQVAVVQAAVLVAEVAITLARILRVVQVAYRATQVVMVVHLATRFVVAVVDQAAVEVLSTTCSQVREELVMTVAGREAAVVAYCPEQAEQAARVSAMTALHQTVVQVDQITTAVAISAQHLKKVAAAVAAAGVQRVVMVTKLLAARVVTLLKLHQAAVLLLLTTELYTVLMKVLPHQRLQVLLL